MRTRISALIAALALAGCGGGGGGGEQAAGGDGMKMGQSVAPLGQGTISGTVNFTGTPPANPTIDMSEEPACKAKYTSAPRDPVVSVTGGKLANVFIYVKSGLPAGPYPMHPAADTLDQDGCLYHPRVLGVQVGQPIAILNTDPVLHNIKAVPTKNRGFNISQPTKGMETERTFATAEMAIPLECNVHGWMHAHVFVMEHPYFAVTGADGSFTIPGLPPGTYTVEAWHEKLGTKTGTVTVPATGSGSVSFSFSG